MQMRRRRRRKQSSPKARQTFTRDAHPHHCTNEPDETHPAKWLIDNSSEDVFADISQTPQDEEESKGEEGTPVAAPAAKKHMQPILTTLVVVVPFSSAACNINT